VKTKALAAVGAIALVWFAAPADATQMNMPGMTMPTPAKKATKTAAAKKTAVEKRAPKGSHVKKRASQSAASPHGHRASSKGMNNPTGEGIMTMPADQETSGSSMAAPVDKSQMQDGTMRMPPQGPRGRQMPMTMHGIDHGGAAMTMKAALGPYPEQRESSGTAWQPDGSSSMAGPMLMSGDWMLMAHGTANLVYDHQSGPRGDDKTFASGMFMGMAQHSLGNGTLQFRAMLSPDPIMGPSGYPLLLASGETANGRDRLIDRQHPHDFFMELSASASQSIGPKSSLFVYAGLPGEPALGPPSFMHRESIEDSPEAPITHHWLDSTHITFGVITAGVVLDRFKIEASRFNGREPDQHRWNIETGPLDSMSARISWNPTTALALQTSWAHLVHPEQLELGVNQTRWSASALWANDVAPDWHAAATLAWGRKSSLGHHDDGIAAEASVRHAGWTIFGRGELVENRELIEGQDEPAFRVGKVSLGAVRDFRIADHFSIGAGGLFSLDVLPDALTPLYGGHRPVGVMGFVRVKLD
jgi:hypothetical protein